MLYGGFQYWHIFINLGEQNSDLYHFVMLTLNDDIYSPIGQVELGCISVHFAFFNNDIASSFQFSVFRLNNETSFNTFDVELSFTLHIIFDI